ncbi:MAG: hypothetical protein Q4D47_01060, partial [Erysipelotrichaceae bacterium]|nr:hypothetical protein [Erysipelotrichaceae bacterium]
SMINFMCSDLSDFCSTLMAIYNSKKIQKAFDENKAQLSKDNRINSSICQKLISYQENRKESQ